MGKEKMVVIILLISSLIILFLWIFLLHRIVEKYNNALAVNQLIIKQYLDILEKIEKESKNVPQRPIIQIKQKAPAYMDKAYKDYLGEKPKKERITN